MHLKFSFFQLSSHFSWDTHSKQSFCLDEEGYLWLSFSSFGPWSNSFDFCKTLHASSVISSCILSILHFFICIVFVLTLLLCFSFVWVKNPKPHKKWKKIKFKSLIVYVWVHIICEFDLVPSYLWRSAFTKLACYACTSSFLEKILISMCDCCKSIFKFVMND